MKTYNNSQTIDFLLLFRGHINKIDLSNYLGINADEAELALIKYLKSNATTVKTDDPVFNIIQMDKFVPIYEHNLADALNTFSSGLFSEQDRHVLTPSPVSINTPSLDVLSKLTQAISNNNAVNLIYTSLSSGSGSREFVPQRIINNGLRWHVRGFDRKSQSFRDFVLTRISRVSIRSNDVQSYESASNDEMWNKSLELMLIPHPTNISEATAIEMDYGMVDGCLRLSTNAALVGYLLRRWNIDATEDARLQSPEYQLWLQNYRVLAGIDNLTIAPGF